MVDEHAAEDQLVKEGPFNKLVVSPSGKSIAGTSSTCVDVLHFCSSFLCKSEKYVQFFVCCVSFYDLMVNYLIFHNIFD